MSTATIDLADHVSESDLQCIGPKTAIACTRANGVPRPWIVVADGEVVASFDDDRSDEAQQVAAALAELRDKLAARRDLIGGIRDLADFLDQCPELPVVRVLAYNTASTPISAGGFRAATETLQSLGAEVVTNDLFQAPTLSIRYKVAPLVTLKYEIAASEVCEMQEVLAMRPVLPDWTRITDQGETLGEAA